MPEYLILPGLSGQVRPCAAEPNCRFKKYIIYVLWVVNGDTSRLLIGYLLFIV